MDHVESRKSTAARRGWVWASIAGGVAVAVAVALIGPASAGTSEVASAKAAVRSVAKPAVAKPAVAPPGYTTTGIDVSVWQGTVNWTKVAASGKFAYIKATEGSTYLSSTFNAQYSGAEAAGLYVGAYAFARPDHAAVAQADYFLSQAHWARNGQTLPPMLDIEWPYTSNGKFIAPYPCYGLSTAAMVAWIQAYVGEIKARTGSVTTIYTAANWWNACTGSSSAFANEPLDIGSYTATPVLPGGWSKWTIWQYATSGSVPGDQNVFNGDVPALAKFARPPRCFKQSGCTAPPHVQALR